MPNTIDNFARPCDGQCQDTEFEINSCNRGRRNRISFVHAIDAGSPEGMKSFLLTNVQEKTWTLVIQ